LQYYFEDRKTQEFTFRNTTLAPMKRN